MVHCDLRLRFFTISWGSQSRPAYCGAHCFSDAIPFGCAHNFHANQFSHHDITYWFTVGHAHNFGPDNLANNFDTDVYAISKSNWVSISRSDNFYAN